MSAVLNYTDQEGLLISLKTCMSVKLPWRMSLLSLPAGGFVNEGLWQSLYR